MAIRKINRETVSKLADVRLMLEEQLDRSLKKAEEALPAGSKNLVHLVLSVFTSSRSAKVELTAPEILEKLASKGLDSDDLKNVLSTLMREEVLRVNAQGEYSIAGSLLNRRVYEKIEAQSLLVRKIQNFIRDRFLIYQERSQLLTQSDLNYIEPYLADISLTTEESAFIEKSKNAINREKRRTIFFLSTVIVLLSALTLFAFFKYAEASRERKRADKEQIRANQEAQKARKAEQEAKMRQREAESLRDTAETEKIRAIAAREEALDLAKLADMREKEARAAQAEAQRQAALNDSLKNEAQALAEKMRLLSEDNQQKAENAQRSAREEARLKKIAQQLRDITLSRQVAIQLQQDEDLIPETKALLAREVFNMNDGEDEGDIHYPDIAQAVYAGYKSLVRNPDFNFLPAAPGMVRSIVPDKTGKTIFTAGSGGTVQMWKVERWDAADAPKTAPLTILKAGDVINTLAISPDGNWLAAGGRDSLIYLFDISPLARSKPSLPFKKINLHRGYEVFQLGFLADGKGLVSSGADFSIRHYDLQTDKSELLATTNDRVEALAFFSDQPAFLFGTTGGEVYRYELEGRQTSLVMKGASKITSLEVRGDYVRHLIVAGRKNGSFSVLNVFQMMGAALLPREFQYHSAAVSDVEIINDSLFAVASLEGKISLWNTRHYLETQYKPMVFNDLEKWATAIAFAPQSKQLIAGSYAAELKFWSLDPAVYAGKICELLRTLGRTELTPEEITKYFGEDYLKRMSKKSVCD